MTYKAATPLLNEGQKVRLLCRNTGKHVRIKDGNMDALGGEGPFTVFVVSPKNGHLRLESSKHSGSFLSHKGSPGIGGPHTHFVAKPTGKPNEFHLRSKNDSVALGFKPDGSVKDPSTVGSGPAGSFTIVPV